MKHLKVLLSEKKIADQVHKLGKKITKDYKGEELIILSILKGSLIFCSDLMRCIELPLKLDFISLSSYGDSLESSGEVVCDRDCKLPIRGAHVLIVEDIIDTGLTIDYLIKMLGTRKPKSLKVCSLLSKPTQVKRRVTIDYLGFEIEDHFVVGYGLDYAQKYRGLPYIGILDEESQ